MTKGYKLLDCGDQRKLEQMGEFKVIRPAPQALWKPVNPDLWADADVEFIRTSAEKGEWKNLKKKEGKTPTGYIAGKMPAKYTLENEDGTQWTIEPNDFGNIGIFTEHWVYTDKLLENFDKKGQILNLFSYSGSSCMKLAKMGYKITAVDASKSSMELYTDNLEVNRINRAGHKLILEDANKFMQREIRRGSKYPSIIIDMPSFGRGTKGEVFTIEKDITNMIETCKQLMEKNGVLVMTLHSPRFTPELMRIFLQQIFKYKTVEVSEILQKCESGVELPSGILSIVK